MANQHATGLARLVNAVRFSAKGLAATFKNEEAFRQECLLFAITLPLAAFIADTALQFVALMGVVVLLMVVELLNSAIETVVDRISEEQHPLSGRAKDQGSAAVMLTIVIALATWIVVILD